ncbi:MAG: hypothetical protein OEX12_08245 [Gammaproteobacteria bacterium]|nr:hypothetical protein [Gammaproteobacteria bacterium]
MVDLFSVTSPLMIRSPFAGEKVIAELFSHPKGIVFLEIFWNQLANNQGFHFIKGDVKGEGPWKVGDYVINILGCHGTNQELAEDFAQWNMYLQMPMNDYPEIVLIEKQVDEFLMEVTKRKE